MYDTMKKIFLLAVLSFSIQSFAQNVTKALQIAYQKFENDSQLSNAISSLYVINAKSGEVIFDRNSKVGLATASTLKVVTAATAYELLGRDFKYKTEFGFVKNDTLNDPVFIRGYGDPTLGSFRYASTKPEKIMGLFRQKLKENGKVFGSFLQVDHSAFETQLISDGWIWQDIGNYYGAGAGGFNWRENQYDLTLKSSSKIGEPVDIVAVNDEKENLYFRNELKSAAKGTGDNAYIYLPVGGQEAFLRGTIPVDESRFTISGAAFDPASYFTADFNKYFKGQNKDSRWKNVQAGYLTKKITNPATVLYTHYSPSLDSIIYWFLKKSINLYGEALTKTFAYQKNGFGETGKGVFITKNFWKEKGIPSTELNIVDGSGLSPLNRVTTHAQVMVLKYAKNQSWFNGYYEAFPEYNGMKMKSGTINGVKGFCGYQKSKDGNEYIFSFLVNNYNGSSSSLVQKMYKVLDELK
jgi:D-alanyl-D-alanine carboxypeptidase/D-alanyl-D-alanine-endopeptidase (penicillin-binding protein 4)